MIVSGKHNGVTIVETSASGRKLAPVGPFQPEGTVMDIRIHPRDRYQEITGFGGSFTEASASLLHRLSEKSQDTILKAYFSREGANYSLTRTHINSCDFSSGRYAYANIPGDHALLHFSIERDQADLIPMIRSAQRYSIEGFKMIASPWTAPPWMKDNGDWQGGKLLPEYRETWALYFSKYITAYRNEGIPVWGITVENEPLGNDQNWESMHFTPEEMRDFVKLFLYPRFRNDGLAGIKILGYDQNRGEELQRWARVLLEDEESYGCFDGMAVHWYGSTCDVFPESLHYTHRLAPEKYLINTEACVDAEVPRWHQDIWYWSEEATDWGWDWAPQNQKHLHPKYAPVFRYAGDIIGCLNNHVNGWIDWNMILDRSGGPNWAGNWCVAPVIADPLTDEIYFTPLYYTISHFSRYIRPGAVRIGIEKSDETLQATALENPDGSTVVVLFNANAREKNLSLSLGNHQLSSTISAKALQTIVVSY